ncbi:hypothetical protein JCM10207_007479 [Rhodosporidiobolus poonsookiae]
MQLPDKEYRLDSKNKTVPRCYAFLKLGGRQCESLAEEWTANINKCYVEARDGDDIEVGFYDKRVYGKDSPEDAFVLRLLIDGKFVNGCTFIKEDPVFKFPKHSPRRLTSWNTQTSGEHTAHPLRIAPFQITEEEDEATASDFARDSVGKIKLCYHRIRNLRFVQASYPTGLQDLTFWEKEKPFAAQQAQLGEPVEVAIKQPWLLYDYIDREEEPLFTFQWHYLPRWLLQGANNIIPDDPKPVSPQLDSTTPSLRASSRATLDAMHAEVSGELHRLQKEVSMMPDNEDNEEEEEGERPPFGQVAYDDEDGDDMIVDEGSFRAASDGPSEAEEEEKKYGLGLGKGGGKGKGPCKMEAGVLVLETDDDD